MASRLLNALRGEVPREFLSRQAILAVARHVLLSPPTNPTRRLPTLVNTVLAVHGYAERLVAKRSPDGAQIGGMDAELVLDMFANAAFHTRDDVGAALARHLWLWHCHGPAGAPQLKGRFPTDLALEATGMSIDELLAAGFALYSHISIWEPGRPVVMEQGRLVSIVGADQLERLLQI